MELATFLATIWPAGEHFFLMKKSSPPQHYHVATVEAAVARINKSDAEPEDIYYAMASFKGKYIDEGGKKKQRTQTNVAHLKCLWVDLDCKGTGEKNDYPSQREAILDIRRLSTETGIPLPTVLVNSGYGIHAYWVLDRDLTSEQWNQIAPRWRALLDKHEVRHDPKCTTDSARVLRPIGTHNKKRDEPAKVSLIGEMRNIVNLDKFLTYLPEVAVQSFTALAPAHLRGVSELNNMAMDAVEHAPSSILEIVKSCGLLREVASKHGDVPEPLWYAALGVVGFTTQAERAVHTFSDGYAGYTEEETNRKVIQWKSNCNGAATCKNLDEASTGYSDACSKCSQRGKINSPISLGYSHVTLVEINPLTGVTESIEEMPEDLHGFRWQGNFMERSVIDKEATKVDKVTVYEWVKFCAFYFHPFAYFRDGLGKLSMVWKLRELSGSWREFELSGSAMGTGGATLFSELGEIGIVATTGGKPHMEAYITNWFNEIKKKSVGVDTYTHFGWHGEEFLHGDIMYSPGSEQRKVKLSGGALALSKHLVPAGSLEAWKDLIDQAYNHDGQEQYQFLMGAGFGSVLMEFAHIGGGMTFSAVSTTSGEGKTYSQQRAASIYGDYSEGHLMLSKTQVTYNALFAMAGIMHSMPVILDETTNMKADVASDTVYTHSQGSPRVGLRQDGSLNMTRYSWKLPLFISGNKSMVSIINSAKPGADAELARIFEFEYKAVSPFEKRRADALFRDLSEQWGYAGIEIIKYVVDNREACIDLFKKVQVMIDEKARFVRRDRFWSAGVAVNITGTIIARKIGLIKWEVQPVIDWVIRQANEMRGVITENVQTSGDNFKNMVIALSPGLIVTDKEGDKRAGEIALVIQAPKTAYTGRAISKTGEAYFLLSKVREWCNERQLDYREIIKAGKEEGYLLDPQQSHYTIGKGTEYMTGTARCVGVNWNKLDIDRVVSFDGSKVVTLRR